VTEQSYEAWDGKKYKWPPPSGWYLARDKKWWPDGYGPKSDGNQTSEGSSSENVDIKDVARPDVDLPKVEDVEVSELDAIPDPPQGYSSSAQVEETPVSVPVAEPVSKVDSSRPVKSSGTGFGAGNRFDIDESGGSGGFTKILLAGIGLLVLGIGALLLSRMFSSDEGNFASPHPVGFDVSIDEPGDDGSSWVVRVLEPAETISSDEFGALASPDSGNVYLKADVSVEAQKDDVSLDALSFEAASSVDNTYQLDDDCMAQTGALVVDADSSVATGFVCWQVPESEVSDMRLGVQVEGVSGAAYLSLSE